MSSREKPASSSAVASELELQVLRAVLVRADEGQVHVGLGRARQLVLGALRRLLEALQCHRVAAQVDSRVLQEPLGQPLYEHVVEVLPAEERIAVGALDLEDSVTQLEDRDIERPPAEIEDRVGQRCGRGLVDDPHHLEPRDRPGLLGGLALRVVEVGGDRDHRLGDGLAEEVGGRVPELLQHHRRDLLRRALLLADLDPGVSVVCRDDVEGCDAGE
jgi:hypothetical protein